jgi:hypothetical protein
MLLACLAMATRGAESAAERHFTERVKPLLDSRCISCHGPDKVKGGLRMDSREGLMKGGDTGPAIAPGKSAESLLVQAVMHSKKELEMPPKEKLTSNDVAVLRRWIDDGAPWPKSLAANPDAILSKPGERIGDAWSDPRNPIVRLFGGQRLDLWSLQPITVTPAARSGPAQERSIKATRSAKGAPDHNEIDRFITAKLAGKKLRLSPEADRRTLARRLYFDLTGLPPSPEELDSFERDRRPDACERLVDRLLDSPRYGEHQARLWMDVVRYSDSNGFDWDEFRPRAWRFRDYLIRSFNADKPFDQLVREHIAGDELIDGAPKNKAEQEALIATTYLRLGPQDNSAPLFNEQDRSRAELMADLTETTASAFLGLTMSCNRCHDHKYDPLSHADHFRMRAFFEPVKYADDAPIDLAPEQEAVRAHNQGIDAKIKPIQEKRDALINGVKKKLRDGKVAKLSAEDQALIALPKEKRTNDLKDKIAALEKKIEVKDKEVQAGLSAEQKKENEAWGREMDALKKQKKSLTLALLMTDNAEKVPVTKVLFQGNHKDPREAVVPGFPSVLDPNPAEIRKPLNAKTTGRRLTLAEWIVSTNNPLTARVFVNRVWQQHFGEGVVATANDFGLAGARPTHPELLDWLAAEFVRQGWSIKQLHRLIVTSAAYRQSSSRAGNRTARLASEVDRDNRLLWRQNIRRLTAEQLRDALLAVSGSLNVAHAGGPPIWPELPPEILQANPAFLDDNATKTKGWYPSPKTNQNVRSVYLIQKKTVRVPFMETFDMPENSVSCGRRTESTVAPQALSLLNGALAIEAAQALAKRVQDEAGADPAAQVQRAFAFALQRSPARDELRACVELIKQRSLVEFCRALLNINEFFYID